MVRSDVNIQVDVIGVHVHLVSLRTVRIMEEGSHVHTGVQVAALDIHARVGCVVDILSRRLKYGTCLLVRLVRLAYDGRSLAWVALLRCSWCWLWMLAYGVLLWLRAGPGLWRKGDA